MNKNILASLLEVAKLLNDNNVKWMLVGSSNLALQGMNFEPGDIDLVSFLEDEQEILALMKKYELLKTEKLIKKEGEEKMFLVGEKVVEFLFEDKDGLYSKYLLKKDYLRKKVKGVGIPCMKLENEILAYEYLDRTAKAGMIRDFLKKFR